MSGKLGRIVIYTSKLEEMIAFYRDNFDFDVIENDADRITELSSKSSGANILLHPAAKGQRQGQSLVKLVFDFPDVQEARDRLLEKDIAVGPIHDAGDYQFANLKDPSGNSVSLSSRAFKV